MLYEVITDLARSLGLREKEMSALREIGRLLNYNGYGMDESDSYNFV